MSEPIVETEVLIAGGGPCGLMLAIELGRRGIACMMVDPKPGTAFNPQANATQARTMEHFRRLGFADEIRAQGLPPDHPTDIAYFTRFCGEELARLSLPTAAQAVQKIRGLGGSWSAAELPHRVSQKFVEASMLRLAQRHAGNDLRYGWRLLSFNEGGDGVEAQIAPVQADAAGATKIRARYLVGADGARSLVRNTLGFGWKGETGIRREFMGGKMIAVYLRAPAFYEQFPHARAWMYVSFNAERRAFMATVDGKGEFAFHAVIHEGEDAEAWGAREAREVFRQALGIDVPVEILSTGTWLAGHALYAEKMQTRRVFIAGDAAHLFTPTGGLGYNTAIEDAVNLAWKLASVIRGVAPEGLLDSYEAERLPVARRNTGYARRFADSVGGYKASPYIEDQSPEGREARRLASIHLNEHVRLEFNIPGVTFGARYDGSPVIVGDGTSAAPDAANEYLATACPGGRPPHAWLADGRSLFDSFHVEWTLLALGETPPETAGFVSAATELGLDLAVVRHRDERLRTLYEAPLALIRPDQVVAWRGMGSGGAMDILRKVTGRT